MYYLLKKRIPYFIIEKLTKPFKKIILTLSFIAFIFPCVFSSFKIEVVNASIINDDKLINRISKDFTNKFCNSLAFGLSKESAMKFSNNENNLIFKNKKGFNELPNDFIANKIAISVVEDCGYLINLRGEDGIREFEDDYISMNNF